MNDEIRLRRDETGDGRQERDVAAGLARLFRLRDHLRGNVEKLEAAPHRRLVHIDALSAFFVLRPAEFDVVVASNLFGDILTDLGGAIIGGIGIAASANINPERRYPSMFEPVHGSAPDIAGRGIANPAAAILSAAMLLRFLHEAAAAAAIETAVAAALEAGITSPDLGGTASTTTMGTAIAERVMSS